MKRKKFSERAGKAIATVNYDKVVVVSHGNRM